MLKKNYTAKEARENLEELIDQVSGTNKEIRIKHKSDEIIMISSDYFESIQ